MNNDTCMLCKERFESGDHIQGVVLPAGKHLLGHRKCIDSRLAEERRVFELSQEVHKDVVKRIQAAYEELHSDEEE